MSEDIQFVLDEEKIKVFRKLSTHDSVGAKEALLAYLDAEFGVAAPKNYSLDRMIKVGNEKAVKVVEQRALNAVIESEEFKRTNVTPFDILKGDKSVIEYKEPVYVHPSEIVAAMPVPEPKTAKALEQKITKRIVHDVVVPEADLILPKTFKPAFDLSMKTEDGRNCAHVGYWITDEIVKLGHMWKLGAITNKYSRELMTLVYYIQKYGSVIVRESRHSTYVILK